MGGWTGGQGHERKEGGGQKRSFSDLYKAIVVQTQRNNELPCYGKNLFQKY